MKKAKNVNQIIRMWNKFGIFFTGCFDLHPDQYIAILGCDIIHKPYSFISFKWYIIQGYCIYIYPTNYKISFFALGVKVVQGPTSSRGLAEHASWKFWKPELGFWSLAQ